MRIFAAACFCKRWMAITIRASRNADAEALHAFFQCRHFMMAAVYCDLPARGPGGFCPGGVDGPDSKRPAGTLRTCGGLSCGRAEIPCAYRFGSAVGPQAAGTEIRRLYPPVQPGVYGYVHGVGVSRTYESKISNCARHTGTLRMAGYTGM